MTSTREKIELSKDGLKVSYLRFLSDSAGGYIIILVLLLSFYRNYPIFSIELQNYRPLVSNDVKLFILVLLFFLSTPLGLMLNGISWFFLGCLTIKLESCFSDKNCFYCFFLKSTRIASLIDNWKNEFGVNSKNWYSYSATIETLLIQFHPDIVSRYDHVEGVKILSRNLALISLLSVVNGVCNCAWTIVILSVCFFILFSIVTASLGFYYHSALFRDLDPICLKVDDNYLIHLNNELDFLEKKTKLQKLIIRSSKLIQCDQ